MPVPAPWLWWAFASAVFAAATAVFARIGVAAVPPDVATLVRTGIVLIFAAAIVVFSGEARALGAIGPRTWGVLALSGLATGASWLCWFRALSLGEASRVAPIDKLSVVLVAVFGVVFLGERLSPTNWLGVALIAAGAVLVAIR